MPPARLNQLAAAFERTGNVSAAAREVGLPISTARNALRRNIMAKRRALHARACEAGLRAGRRALRDELTRLTTYTVTAVGDGTSPSVEPRDYAALVRAQADLNRVLLAHAERVSAARTERLQRDVTRAKLEALRGLGAELAGATDEELATVRAILERARARGGPATIDRGGTSTPGEVEPPRDEPR